MGVKHEAEWLQGGCLSSAKGTSSRTKASGLGQRHAHENEWAAAGLSTHGKPPCGGGADGQNGGIICMYVSLGRRSGRGKLADETW